MSLHRSAVPLLAAVTLAGCATGSDPAAAPPPITPTEQFSVEVRSTVDEILLAPHGGLSPAQDAALADLAARWRDAGEGPVIVHAAGGGPAERTAHAAAHALQAAGVPPPLVQVMPYDAPADAPPEPVRVGYSRLVAVGPHCANLWSDLTRSARNGPSRGFGCSVTANMAAQIANPRDLISPRPSYPADAARRAIVLDKYRTGEPTGAARGDDERGDVSAATK